MSKIEVTERNVKAGEDRYLVLVDGAVFTSHPTRKGAEKIALRLAAGERF